MQTERRKNRSTEKYQAIGLQFETLRAQQGAQLLALIDEEGMLLGASGDERHCEELGCRLAEQYRRQPPKANKQWDIAGTTASCQLTRHGAKLYLGVRGQLNAEQMNVLAESVERIFQR
jgi:hypothetical protein